MSQSNSFIITQDHITIVFSDGFQTSVVNSNKNFYQIKQAIINKEWNIARQLCDTAGQVERSIANHTEQRVTIHNGVVFFNQKPLHTTLTSRIVRMVEEGFDVTPMLMFLDNLMDNPSYRAVNELYDFLQASNLPITPDGHFLAYKKIRSDYTDVHTGTIDNSIGTVVKMERNQVDEDKESTCSWGLHFCSREYLEHFNGSRIVSVKINPRDVVAIPVDYNNSKGRACRYEVMQELCTDETVELEDVYDHHGDTRSTIEQLDMDDQVVDTHTDIQEAAIASGILAAYIKRVLTGGRQSTGGYKWRYRVRTESPTTTPDCNQSSWVFNENT